MVITFALLLIAGAVPEPSSPPLRLILEEQAGLDAEAIEDLLHELVATLERYTGAEVELIHGGWNDCAPRSACIRGLQEEIPAEIVALRIFGGPSLIRLGFERYDAQGALRTSGEIDVPKDPPAWPGPIRAWCERSFADRSLVAVLPPVTPIADAPSVAPWVLLGGATLSAVVGVIFAVSAESARAEALTGPRFADEQEPLRDRVAGQALAADLLLGTAALGAVGAAVWLLVQ